MERERQTFPNLFAGMASREEDTGIALREKVGLLKAALGGSRRCPFLKGLFQDTVDVFLHFTPPYSSPWGRDSRARCLLP